MIFFAKFTFSAKMGHVETHFFNITYKEGRFYQKRSELGFRRCGSGRKSEMALFIDTRSVHCAWAGEGGHHGILQPYPSAASTSDIILTTVTFW